MKFNPCPASVRQKGDELNIELNEYRVAEVVCKKLAQSLAMLPLPLFNDQLDHIKMFDRLVTEQKRCAVAEMLTGSDQQY